MATELKLPFLTIESSVIINESKYHNFLLFLGETRTFL